MDPLTAIIVDTASEMNVRLLDKSVDASAQQALRLFSTLPAGSPSGGGVGQGLDVIA